MRVPAAFSAVSFQWPLVLVALVAVPIIAAVYLRRERGHGGRAARFANPALLPNLLPRSPGGRRHIPFAIFLVALAALLVGAARPHAHVSTKREEATVVLAIDVSRSMTAKDVRPTRLGAARAAAEEFVRKVPSKFRVGVVSFASRATTAVPPTLDRDLVHEALDVQRAGLGTALGDAVSLSVTLGRRARSRDGRVPPTAVVMISDGSQQGGNISWQRAVARARRLHVPVYTILVGTPRGVVRQTVQGGFVETTQVPPNPAALRAIARMSGGRYFTARNDERLREVYENLSSRLGKHTTTRELTDVFAAGSAALLLAGASLSTIWFRRPL
jgi:Ca-activated chloride channel family protein